MGDDQQAAQQQDYLRPVRQFVSQLQQALGSDQSYASTDGVVANPPRQFVVIGTAGGQAVEGQPILTGGAGLAVPMWVVLLAGGALAWHLLKH